jgi:alpha-beta hydrolase superfamily lysophospholipase
MVVSLLFFPGKDFYETPANYGLKPDEVFLTTSDRLRLHGWFFQAPQNKAALLLFHGNAGNISGRLFKVPGWLERGISVFLVDYRGYGRSEGKIKRGEDLLEDARSALRWLNEEKSIPAQKIILYGESLGAYPAIGLAGSQKFAGLILESPFSSVLEVARVHYGRWIPEILVKDFQMKNQELISQVKAPVFIMHGSHDEICPVEMGERLYKLAPAPKELYVVLGAGHNNMAQVAGNAYVENAYQFLAKENGFG